jgi:hypothetical protein
MTKFRNGPQATSDPDLTLGGRLVAAFASLFFSVPLMFLFWLLFNSSFSVIDNWHVSFQTLALAISCFALLSFVFPKLAPTVFGWLSDLLLALGKYW